MANRKNAKKTNIDIHSTAQKTQDWASRTHETPGMNASTPEGITVIALLVPTIIVFTLLQEHHLTWKSLRLRYSTV